MRTGPAPPPSAFRRLHLSLRRVAPFPLGVAGAKASPAWDAGRPAGSEVHVPAVRLPRRAARVHVGWPGTRVHGTFRYAERPAEGGREPRLGGQTSATGRGDSALADPVNLQG